MLLDVAVMVLVVVPVSVDSSEELVVVEWVVVLVFSVGSVVVVSVGSIVVFSIICVFLTS